MRDFTLDELKTAVPFSENGRWIAPAYRMTDGRVGGYIFNTEEEAKGELVLLISRMENKIKWKAEEDKRKQDEINAENALILSYKGFLDENPMKAGKQRATLEKTAWFQPVSRMVSKKEFVEIVLADGYKPNTRQKMKKVSGGYLEKDGDKIEYILTKDGSSYVVNKTEHQYAEYVDTQNFFLG